jgi:hypothetical protein
MALRKVFIKNREFIPEVAEVSGTSIIELEYEFAKAELWAKDVCIVEIDITPEQAAEIDRRARAKKKGEQQDGEDK